ATVWAWHCFNHSTTSSNCGLKTPNWRTGLWPAGTLSAGTQTKCAAFPKSIPAACGCTVGICLAGLIWPVETDLDWTCFAIIGLWLKFAFFVAHASPAFGRKQHTLLNGITAATARAD